MKNILPIFFRTKFPPKTECWPSSGRMRPHKQIVSCAECAEFTSQRDATKAGILSLSYCWSHCKFLKKTAPKPESWNKGWGLGEACNTNLEFGCTKKIKKDRFWRQAKVQLRGGRVPRWWFPAIIFYNKGTGIYPKLNNSNIGFSPPSLYIRNGNWKIILCQYVSLGSRSTHMYCMFWPQLVNVFLTSSWPLGNWSDYKAFIDNYLYPIKTLVNWKIFTSYTLKKPHYATSSKIRI